MNLLITSMLYTQNSPLFLHQRILADQWIIVQSRILIKSQQDIRHKGNQAKYKIHSRVRLVQSFHQQIEDRVRINQCQDSKVRAVWIGKNTIMSIIYRLQILIKAPLNLLNKTNERVKQKRVIQQFRQVTNDLLVFQCILNRNIAIINHFINKQGINMIKSRKQKCCFIIRNNFVMIMFHQSTLRIQQINVTFLESDIFFVQLDKVPQHISHLFNSVNHIYKYLKTHPQCMIQMTEQYLKFIVQVNGKIQICSLELKMLQLQKNSLKLKKKGYEICMKSQQLKQLKQKYSNQSRQSTKKLQQSRQFRQMQRQKLHQILQTQKMLIDELKNKKAESLQLQQSLRHKQEILMQIKMKQGAFVTLDD